MVRVAGLTTFLATFVVLSSSGRVAELGDKFLEYVKKGDISPWLVMFYAPWCHHCKQMEPTFMEAATDIQKENLGVYVGKIDCTKYTSLASHFSIRGFPTVLFIDKDKVVEFNGDRTIDDLVDFARRLSGQSILPVKDCDHLNLLKNKHNVLFTYFGPDPIWPNFTEVADSLHSSSWFFHSKQECPGYDHLGIYIIKPSSNGKSIDLKFDDQKGITLKEWIMANRFPQFVHISYANFNSLIHSAKLLAIGLIEASRITLQTSQQHAKFRDELDRIAHTFGDQNLFIFGWTSQSDLINSIVMHTIEPLPNFVVINSSSLEFYRIDGDISPPKISELLSEIKNGAKTAFGGNRIHHRFIRMCYDGYSSVAGMYKGNPILTLLVFGLPLSFLSIILYSSCCSDIFDAPEENEDDGEDEEKDRAIETPKDHEKKE